MKVTKLLTVVLAIFALSGFGELLHAQQAGSAGKVDHQIKRSQNVIPAGDTAAVAVVMQIEEIWHVNANKPTLDYLIGTELNIDVPSGFSLSNMQYPESERFTFAFAEEPLDV
ncbi:MAG: hypothetical protein U5K69_28420 [Balneolaceae bacterium]|nr:hypothetical protein [Balneolaceae bacterium]